VIDSATSVDHLFELLRLAGCLTSRGRSNRSMVLATMTRARDQFEPPYTMGAPPDEGHACASIWETIEEPLTNSGYLQVAAWPDAWKYITMMSVEERVHGIVEQARASAGSPPDSDTPWLYQAATRERERRRATAEPGPLSCPDCRKPVPDAAQFCVWCQAVLPFACSCGS
jgi:hypothetical protein